MAKCIEPKDKLVKLMKGVKGKSTIFKNTRASRLKPERFPTSKIINSLLVRVFSNNTDDDYEAKKEQAITEIEAIVKDGRSIIPAFWKKMKGMSKLNSKDISMFKNEDGSNATGMQIIQRGLAAQHVFASVKSEHDLSIKYNLSEDEINDLQRADEVTPAIAALGNLAAIGREIAYTQDVSYSPRRKGVDINEAQWEMEKSYARVGLKAMQSLEDSGVISINDNGQIINRGFKKKEDGSLFSGNENLIGGMSISINMENMIPDFYDLSEDEKNLISRYMKKDTDGKETRRIQDKYPVLSANVNAANWVHKLKVPSNLKLPDFEYSGATGKVEKAKHDVKVHEDTQSILDDKQKGTLVVSKELESMFDYIAKYMEDNKVSFEQAAMKLDSAGYKQLMGFSDELDSTSATRDSDRGKSLSKTVPIADFFDNYILFRKLPFHLQEEIKRNGRGHYMNTVLNPQTDKFFSRFVVSIEPYTLSAFKDGIPTDVFYHMVKAVEDQAGSGLTQDSIMNHSANKDLDYLLASYENALKDGRSMFTFMSLAFKNSKVDLAGSPWEKMDTLKGILSIRNAVEDASEGGNSSLVGSFMPKPDGTASGAVIMALQMAGKDHGNASLYEALGLDRADVKAGLRDAYEITEKVLIDLIKNDDAIVEKKLASAILFLHKDTNIYKTLREISKDPSMTVMYNQSIDSAAETLAAGFAEKTYRRFSETKNKKEAELIKNKIYEWMNEVSPDLAAKYEGQDVAYFLSSDNSKEVYSLIKSYLQEEVGLPLANLVDTEFANNYLSGHREFTDKIFSEIKLIQDKTGERVSMATPATIVAETIRHNKEKYGDDWKFDPENFELLPDEKLKGLEKRGVPMMKLFEVVENPKEDNTVMRKELLHNINGKVNSIHSIDFAILNEAFRRTFEEYSNGGSKDFPLNPDDVVKYGTVSVHDAISANPEFSMLYEKHYREAARDVNMMFDINKQLAHSLMMMTDGTNKNANDIYSEASEFEQNKIDTLANMPWDTKKIFGFDDTMKSEPNIKNGRSNRKTLSIKAKKENDSNQESMDSKEMLTDNISIVDAKDSYEAVDSLIQSGDDYFTMDTETTNRDKDGNEHNGVKPSDVLSVTLSKMNGTDPVLNEDGDPIVRTFYFQGNPTEGATAVHGLSNKVKQKKKTINQLVKSQEGGKDFKSNQDVWNAFSDYVGGTPMTAYNANFDMDSLNITKETTTGKKGGFDFNSDVYDMYGAAVYALNENGIPITDSNKMKDVYNKLGLGENMEWNDDEAHTSEYDVARMNDIIKATFKKKIVTKDGTVLEFKSENPTFLIAEDTIPDSVLSDKTYKDLDLTLERSFGYTDILHYLRDKPKTYKYINYLYERAGEPTVNPYLKGNDIDTLGVSGQYSPSTHTVGVANQDSTDDIIATLIHELTHAITYNEIENNPRGSFTRTIKRAFIEAKKESTDSPNAYWRKNIHEFTAELFSRNDLKEHFEGIKGRPEEKAFFKHMLDAIISLILGKNKNETVHKTMYDTLLSSFKKVSNGKKVKSNKILESRSRKHKNKSTKKDQKESLRESLNYVKNTEEYDNGVEPISQFMTNNNDWVADLLWNHLGPDAESLAKKGAIKVDEYLTENSDHYVKTKRLLNDVWDSDSMQQIKSWLVPSMIKNRKDMQEFQAMSSDASKKANKLTSTELSKLDAKMVGMTAKDKAKLNTIFARTPIFMLIKNGTLLDDIANGTITVKEAIASAEQNTNSKADIKLAKDMSKMYVDGTVDSLILRYNIEESNIKDKDRKNIEILTALYSLDTVDNVERSIQNTKKNKSKLFNSLVDLSVSLEKITVDSYASTGSKMSFRGNFTLDYYKEPISIRVLTSSEFDKLESSDSDEYSVVMTAEENHGYPVVAFNQISSYQQGLGTNIGYGQTDAMMPKEFSMRIGKSSGLVRTGSSKNPRYIVVIPHKKKQELGLIENPAHTLIRSFAHMQEVVETQAIRDEILNSNEVRMSIPSLESGYQDKIVDKIKDKNKDEPWVITLGSNIRFIDLPYEIRHRYKKVDSKLSNVGVFNSKISLVRRDVAPWLIGYKKTEPFAGVPILGKTARVVAQAVALMKIHQIIVNPAKVTLDAISTTTLLVSNGVSLPFILAGWKRNIPLVSQYSELRAKQVELSVKAYTGDKKAKSDLAKIEQEIKEHKLSGAMQAGVSQSLSTDIILRDYDTITGLQRNIERILEKATNKDDGSLNNFGEAVIAFANAGSGMGLNIENVFEKIASLADDTENFKQIAEELRVMGERVSTMKNNKEAARYLAEYFASPDSNLTRLGSIATTYPDMMSRIIYRQYLISNWAAEITRDLKRDLSKKKITLEEYHAGVNRAKEIKSESDMTDAEIVILNSKVSDFMPDYLYAPPQIVDTLGRFYVTPFISFTARIQRTIAALAERNPVTIIGMFILANVFGMNVGNTPYHIIGSNITEVNFIDNPIEDLMDMNTIFPTKVGNFDVLRF